MDVVDIMNMRIVDMTKLSQKYKERLAACGYVTVAQLIENWGDQPAAPYGEESQNPIAEELEEQGFEFAVRYYLKKKE